MQGLDVVTMLLTVLMTGVEFAVAAFVDPALKRQKDRAVTKDLAQTLGKVMPFWYGACLLLLGAEWFLRRHEPGGGMLLGAAVLWLGTIVYTVALLVPINNRIAGTAAQGEGFDWEAQHARWDMLHRVRVGVLLVAILLFLRGLGGM